MFSRTSRFSDNVNISSKNAILKYRRGKVSWNRFVTRIQGEDCANFHANSARRCHRTSSIKRYEFLRLVLPEEYSVAWILKVLPFGARARNQVDIHNWPEKVKEKSRNDGKGEREERAGRRILRPERFSGDLPATAGQRRNIQTTFLSSWWRLACMEHRWLYGGGSSLPRLASSLLLLLLFSIHRAATLLQSLILHLIIFIRGPVFFFPSFFFFFVSLSSFIIRDFLRFHSSEFFLHLPNLDFYSCPQISFNFCSLAFLLFYILCSSFMVLTESCIIDFSKTCLNFPILHSFDELFSFVPSMLLY